MLLACAASITVGNRSLTTVRAGSILRWISDLRYVEVCNDQLMGSKKIRRWLICRMMMSGDEIGGLHPLGSADHEVVLNVLRGRLVADVQSPTIEEEIPRKFAAYSLRLRADKEQQERLSTGSRSMREVSWHIGHAWFLVISKSWYPRTVRSLLSRGMKGTVSGAASRAPYWNNVPRRYRDSRIVATYGPPAGSKANVASFLLRCDDMFRHVSRQALRVLRLCWYGGLMQPALHPACSRSESLPLQVATRTSAVSPMMNFPILTSAPYAVVNVATVSSLLRLGGFFTTPKAGYSQVRRGVRIPQA